MFVFGINNQQFSASLKLIPVGIRLDGACGGIGGDKGRARFFCSKKIQGLAAKATAAVFASEASLGFR